MIQLKYLGYDIYKNLLKFVFTCIQFIAVLYLFTFVINLADEANMVENEMISMMEKMNIYILQNITEDYHFSRLVSGNEYYSKMLELDQFIKNNESVEQYTVDSSMDAVFESNVALPKKAVEYEKNGRYNITQIRVTGNFYMIFDLKGDFNINEIKKLYDSCSNTNNIPVILGADFKDYYKKGDIIYDIQSKPYEVIGFFEKGQYYIAPYRELKIFYLDSVFVVPSISMSNDSLNYTFNFLASYFISDNKENMKEIVNKSKDLGLYDLKIRNFKKQLQIISQDKIEAVLFNMTLGILILIMSVIGLFGNIAQFISDNMYEFSVHLICGARKISIFIRVALQVTLLIIISNAVNLYIFHFNKASIFTLVGSIVLGGLILIYPLISIYSKNIIMLIRRYSN
ncbi:hypothetical protein AN1V17_32570 [Vallitalea sediminicola]